MVLDRCVVLSFIMWKDKNVVEMSRAIDNGIAEFRIVLLLFEIVCFVFAKKSLIIKVRASLE